MVAFSRRHRGYQLGVLSLYATTALFLLGNFAPQWLQYSHTEVNAPFKGGILYYRKVTAHSSALAGCCQEEKNGTSSTGVFFASSSSTCGTGYYVDSTAGAYVRVCQAFEATGVAALLLGCIYTLRVNFCKAELGPTRRYAEAATVTSGTLGFLGSIVFVGKLGGTVRDSQLYFFSWSLFFTIFVSLLVIVVGVVIAIFNRPAASSGQYERIN